MGVWVVIRQGGMRGLCLALCLLASLAAPMAQADGDTGVHYALFIDPTSRMGVEDLTPADFHPVETTFGGGFTKAAYWLRVSFDAADPPPMILRLRPRTTDVVQLFSRLPDGRWTRSETGDSVLAQGDVRDRMGWLGFEIDPAPGHGSYFLRVITDSPGAVTVSTIPKRSEYRNHLRSAAWNALVFALHFTAIALVMLRLNPLRSLTQFAYLAMTLSVTVYLLWFRDFAPLILGLSGETSTEVFQQCSTAVTVLSITAFHYLFLRDYGPPRPVLWFGRGLAALASLSLGCAAVGLTALSLRVATLCFLSLIPYLALSVLTLRHESTVPRAQVRFVYAAFIATLAVDTLLRLGIVKSEPLYRHSVDILSIASSTLILSLVWLRKRVQLQRDLQSEVHLSRLSAELSVARDYANRQRAIVADIDHVAQRLSDETRAAISAGAYAEGGSTAERSVSGLQEVIDRCRFALEAEDAHWKVTPEPFFPAEAVRDMALTLAPAPRWHLNHDLVRITSDKGLFDLVTRNLLSNALRYGTADEPILLHLRRDTRDGRAGVMLSVSNSCTLKRPFERARVFDKFYRGDSARGVGGTGLGLSITRDVAAQLSGSIEIEARPEGSGSLVTARFWLPEVPG